MAYAILFNGPPGSGKDFLSKAIEKEFDYFGVPHHHLELKQALQAACMAFLGYPNHIDMYSAQKDLPQRALTRTLPSNENPVLYKRDTLRAFMIAMSEDFLKPRYGRDIHARILFSRHTFLAPKIQTFVTVSDLGFDEEVKTFCDNLGAENVLIIKLFRDGTDFSRDSRSYVNSFGANVMVYDNSNRIDQCFLEAFRERLTLLGWLPNNMR